VATGAPAGGPGNDGRLVLANQHVRLGVRPGLGAKVDSLASRPAGREWLITPRAELPGRHVYGSAFTGTTLCGWDEMLPTVDSVTTEVDGQALPYRLRRSVRLDEAAVDPRYTVTARAEAELALLWCPHPQFSVRPGTRLLLPPAVTELTAVAATPDGAALSPVAVSEAGLDCTELVPAGQDMMLYLDPEKRADWAKLRDPDGAGCGCPGTASGFPTWRCGWTTAATPRPWSAPSL